MRTIRSPWLLSLVALCFVNAAAALDSGFGPPLAVFYRSDFDPATTSPQPGEWQVDTGEWRAANGTYDSTAAAPTAVSTIFEYFTDPNGSPSGRVAAPFTCRARLLNQSAAAASLVGVVYDYADAANYVEVVFSPTGTATVRSVRAGAITNVASTSSTGGGRNVWFDVEVERTAQLTTTIRVNGIAIFGALPQARPSGRVGLVTHDTTARFDKVAIAFPFGDQPFRESFTSGLTQPWGGGSGQWSVGGGTFNNAAVEPASSIYPLHAGTSLLAEQAKQYIFRARMLNPYGGPGNLVGIQFHVGDDLLSGGFGAAEVLFSPTGVAKINVFYEGANHTVATALYNGRRNTWFDVRLDATFGGASVTVDGVEIFKDVATYPVAVGSLGLVTHWAPGKFDDVWFDNVTAFHPLSATFDAALPAGWTVSGTWNTQGGTLNDTSVSATDIVATNCACWKSDIAYRARLFNPYSGSGNLVGLLYNYQRSKIGDDRKPYAGLYEGDYYEVVFAPTGQAFMNKVLNGVRYRVATGAHSVPSNTWFDVEVLRQGTRTSVTVNGTTIFDRVRQAQPSFGDVGVVTHWAKGRFDDLAVTDAPVR